MKEILTKIQELLKLGYEPVDFQADLKAPNGLLGKSKRMETLMEELTRMARFHQTYIGRIIHFSHADSSAVYVVTKVTSTKAYLLWVNYMDGWQDDILGHGGYVPLRVVREKCAFADHMDTLREERKAELALEKVTKGGNNA